MGRIGPDTDSMSVLPDGVGISLGARVDQNASQERSHRVLNYNEYIVYDVSQVQIKYILKFNTSSGTAQKRTHGGMSNGNDDNVFKM